MQAIGNEIEKELLFSAIDHSLAMIIFNTQGNVVWVNNNFATAMEYEVEEMIGLHHRTFCLPEFATSKSYTDLWDGLRNGKAFQDKIQRVTKQGRQLILEATYMPILNHDNQVEAVIKIATDITKREMLIRDTTSELMAMVEEMTASTNEVQSASQGIAQNMNHLNQESETVRGYIQHIQTMVSSVQNIASLSHILGLNASIEAARAGEHGRGFAVIANEVRELASTSKDAAQDISKQLQEILRSISSMITKMEEATLQVNNNASAMKELKNSYDHIASTVENLVSNV